jgi:glycosyltransferase involved in cell wall biosynthesis
MHIALVVTGGLDRSGRHQVIPALLALVERLARRNRVSAFVIRYHTSACSYPLSGATVHDLGSPDGLVRQYAALVRAIRAADTPFDVVHGYWALPAGVLAAAAGRQFGVPSVVTFDSGELVSIPDIDYGLQSRWRHRVLVKLAARTASAVTVCSRYQEQLARRLGLAPRVIPIGPDATRFVPADRREGPPWRLIQVASLNRVKDQTTLLRAFRALLDRVPDVHLDIVGEDRLAGALTSLARDLRVDSKVTFHGVLPTSEVIPLLQRSHLFVLSSRHEAANVALLEAAGCGVPCVGTAVGYLAEWAPARGLAVAPGDPEALASAAARLLADRRQREDMAAAAREWMLAHDADWTAARFQELYGAVTLRKCGK